MSMTRFTQGKFFIRSGRVSEVCVLKRIEDGEIVDVVGRFKIRGADASPEEQQANARLFAAAPLLYAIARSLGRCESEDILMLRARARRALRQVEGGDD